MKKIITLTIILTYLYACSDDKLRCGSVETKRLVKELHIENTNLNSYLFSIINADLTMLETFYKENVRIEQIRTSSINKEIKKCTCEATLMFDLPNEILQQLKNEKAEEYEIEYSIQETDAGDIYVETYLPDDMNIYVAVYLRLLKEADKTFSKGNVLRFQSKENNGENKYQLSFLSNNKLDIEYRYFDYKRNENAIFENGQIFVTDLPDNYPIGKNKFYILKDDIFKAYNPETGDYDLYHIIE